LALVDESGRPIVAGAMVRIVSVASCVRELPKQDQNRLRSYEGKTFQVLEIDRYGMLWFGVDGGDASFSLKPEEVAVL
jgi:hypothetical protein